jgi:hypothetical protein
VIASPEGLRQVNARFPNRLSLPGSRDIYFNAARDVIYMDVRALWSLYELDRSVIAPGLVSLYTPLPRPAGFRKIRNLATPFVDNNLEGIDTLRERPRGQLKGVVDPIRTLRGVPDAIETLGRLNLHFTAMYWENRYGQRDSYLAAIGEWPGFLGHRHRELICYEQGTPSAILHLRKGFYMKEQCLEFVQIFLFTRFFASDEVLKLSLEYSMTSICHGVLFLILSNVKRNIL